MLRILSLRTRFCVSQIVEMNSWWNIWSLEFFFSFFFFQESWKCRTKGGSFDIAQVKLGFPRTLALSLWHSMASGLRSASPMRLGSTGLTGPFTTAIYDSAVIFRKLLVNFFLTTTTNNSKVFANVYLLIKAAIV